MKEPVVPQTDTCSAVLILAALLFFFAGCTATHQSAEDRHSAAGHRGAVDLSNAKRVTRILYQHLNEWQGVPYRTGGLSKTGIDCSGSVQTTFLTAFGIRIPRSTELQAAAGYGVPLKKLMAGDLVFFRTGVKTRHVGIYVENNLFIHASKSSGVMLSCLDDAYWKKKYWKAVRIKI
jgi:cell wall-associated NlpC family hydrolase